MASNVLYSFIFIQISVLSKIQTTSKNSKLPQSRRIFNGLHFQLSLLSYYIPTDDPGWDMNISFSPLILLSADIRHSCSCPQTTKSIIPSIKCSGI